MRIKATSLLLLGQNDLALDALRDSFDAKDYLQWWYTLESDPVWMPLHENGRFLEIRAAVQQHVAQQAGLLVALRQKKLIPQRQAADTY
jgi:hypothetical protein